MVVIPSTSLSRALGKVNHQYVFVYQFTTKYLQCVEKHHAPSRPPELISIAFQSQRRNDSVGSACSSSINFLTIPASSAADVYAVDSKLRCTQGSAEDTNCLLRGCKAQ